HLQPGLGLGAVPMQAALAGGVVEDELVVALAAELLALDAAECGRVVLPFGAIERGARCRAMPGGAVAATSAAHQVHLSAGAVIGRVGEGAGVCRLRLATRCAGHAAIAAA